MVVFLVDYPDFAIHQRQLEHGYPVIAHELRRYRSANEPWELLLAARNVLLGLNRAMFVGTALGLHRHHKLATMAVNTDVDFVDLDLPNFLYRGAQMILK